MKCQFVDELKFYFVIPVLPEDVRERFPFEPRWVDVGGQRMHYVDEGPRTGAAVVLLHGNPTWSFAYRNIIPPLVSAGYRVIAIDHLGSGRSDPAFHSGAYALCHHISRTLSVLDHAGVHSAVFFLQDWGSAIGMGCGLARPGLFRGGVLGNAFWGEASIWHSQVFPWRTLHGPIVGPLLFGRRSGFVEGAMLGMPAHLSDVERRAYLLPWQVHRAGGTLAWPRSISLGGDHPTQPLADALWDWMGTADVPVRWVWGADDIAFPPGEQFEAMADRFPRGREHAPRVIEGGHHFIQEFAPEAIAQALIDVAADAGLEEHRGQSEVAATPLPPGAIAPLPVLADDALDHDAAEVLDALGSPWRASSGRTYDLQLRPPWLRIDLRLATDSLAPTPPGEAIDTDLLELAAAVDDARPGEWSARAVRNACRGWSGWTPHLNEQGEPHEHT